MSSDSIGLLFALASAAVWGGADYTGGFSSQKNHAFQVIFFGSWAALGVTIIGAFIFEPRIPSLISILWALLGGSLGGLGLAWYFRALSKGKASAVAPVSGVISAAIPVIFAVITEGLPNVTKLLGFLFGGLGIWLVAQSASIDAADRRSFLLSLPAGIVFGLYYIAMAQIKTGEVLGPMVFSRLGEIIVATIALTLARRPLVPSASRPVAILSALFDLFGTAFYLLAAQRTRLDFAVVLSSLYPAWTVLFFTIFMHQRLGLKQGLGAALCLTAVGLISI